MSRFLHNPHLTKVDPLFDTAANEKTREKRDAVAEIQVLFIQEDARGVGSDKAVEKAVLVFTSANGGVDAADGPKMPVHQDDAGRTTVMPIYQWVGPDRRTLQYNSWKQGHGQGQASIRIGFALPPRLSPGDMFIGGVAKDSKRDLPRQAFTMAVQTNLDGAFAFLKEGPGRTPGQHGFFHNGDAVKPRPAWQYNTCPEEERAAAGMPFEAQVLPRIFGYTPEAQQALSIESLFTPAYAQNKFGVGALQYGQVEAKRHMVRLSINRAPRASKAQESSATAFILPDETVLLERGINKGIIVSIARCNDSPLVSKGDAAGARAVVEEELTLDLLQVRTAPPFVWPSVCSSGL